ncbi:hypothetical protein V6N13_042701 [Hibiscus sabdariffa]
MDIFSEFIDELSLIDLPLQGGCFMRSNFIDRPSFSRLDRFLISPDILIVWADLNLSLHHKSISDHNPISLSISEFCWGPRPFKWFDHLLDDKAYVDKELEKKCADLESKIAAGNLDKAVVLELKASRRSLWDYIQRVEREWIQKSCIKWVQVEDRNTKFFYLVPSARRRSNHIGSLVEGADLLKHHEVMKKSIESHF